MINNVEEFMYEFMSSLYSMNTPIVFKGAMLLKVIQSNFGNPSGLVRETHDLDGDWVGNTPDMNYLTAILQRAVLNAGYLDVEVRPYREYSVGRSAGFSFVDLSTGKEVTTMDLSICKNDFSCKYTLVTGVSFYGQSVNKIIADKVQVCSKRTIMRRVKDIIDLYILSYIWKGYYLDIVNVLNYLGRTLEDFYRFINNYNELEHAYSKYKNKASILPFSQVYNRVRLFIEPFIRSVNYNLYWSGESWMK